MESPHLGIKAISQQQPPVKHLDAAQTPIPGSVEGAVCIQLGGTWGSHLPSPTPGTCPLPHRSKRPAPLPGVGEELAAGIILVCSVLRRGGTPGPLIYGHWYNSFNVIYLTTEEMTNAWRRTIGHAGFVHF